MLEKQLKIGEKQWTSLGDPRVKDILSKAGDEAFRDRVKETLKKPIGRKYIDKIDCKIRKDEAEKYKVKDEMKKKFADWLRGSLTDNSINFAFDFDDSNHITECFFGFNNGSRNDSNLEGFTPSEAKDKKSLYIIVIRRVIEAGGFEKFNLDEEEIIRDLKTVFGIEGINPQTAKIILRREDGPSHLYAEDGNLIIT